MIVRDLLIKLGFQANTSEVGKANKEIERLTKNTSWLRNKMKDLAMQGMGKAAQYMEESAEASIEFGRSMANVSAIMDGSQADVVKLTNAVQSLSTEFGVLPKDVADAAYGVIGNLGYTEDTIGQLRQSIMLAKAGASTTSEAFGLLSAVTRSYGDTSAEAMDRVSNLAAATVRLGALTLPELAGSIQQISPLAKALNVSLEDLFATQASLSGVTGSASEVYTQMGGALSALLKKTPQMEKAWKKVFGKTTVQEAMGKHGVQNVMQKLVDYAHGNQDLIASMFGRKEAMQYVFAITGNMANDLREKLGKVSFASNEVKNSLEKQTTGLGANAFAMDKARAAAEKQRIELGDKLAPAYVNLQIAGGQVAELFGNKIIPLFTEAGNTMEAANSHATVLEGVFKALQIVVAGVSASLDFVITDIRMVIIGIMQASKAAMALAHRDWAGAKAAIAEGVEMEKAAGVGFVNRNLDRARIIAGFDTPSQSAANMAKASAAANDRRSQLGQMGGALGGFLSKHVSGFEGFKQTVGDININVSLPSGTDAQAAARTGDTVAKTFLQQTLAGAVRAFPVGDELSPAY